MNVYIASRTSERELVKKLNKFFKKNGFIALDWTWHTPTKPYEEHKETAKDYSIEDLEMVKKSDIFILLTTESSGTGSTAEFGMALMAYSLFKKPHIYVVGKYINNMFYYHPGVILVEDINKLLKLLKPNPAKLEYIK